MNQSETPCPHCARLAHVAAKSNRRRKALRELNRTVTTWQLMAANLTRQNTILRGKLIQKPGVLRRLWRYLW